MAQLKIRKPQSKEGEEGGRTAGHPSGAHQFSLLSFFLSISVPPSGRTLREEALPSAKRKAPFSGWSWGASPNNGRRFKQGAEGGGCTLCRSRGGQGRERAPRHPHTHTHMHTRIGRHRVVSGSVSPQHEVTVPSYGRGTPEMIDLACSPRLFKNKTLSGIFH